MQISYAIVIPAINEAATIADEIDPAWKCWPYPLLKPDGLYPTRPASGGNKYAKLKAIATALSLARR